jgi:ribosomal protein S18 acetylase RimI-like enzyme
MPTTTATHRRVGPEDLDDVCDVIAACDLATVGFLDFTRDEIAVDLAKETIESTGRYDGQGALVGYGWLQRTERTNQVEIDVYLRPSADQALGPAMVAALEGRAAAVVAGDGHAAPWVGANVYRQDEATQEWLRGAGFRRQTTFTRMRIDLDPGDPPAPARAPGVTIRQVTGEADLRVAHEIEEAAFLEHYGNVPISFDSWRQRLTDRGPDFRRVYLADLDGAPAGLLVATRQFEEDEDAGYVRTLGVLPAGRGRGVGTSMLRDYFARARDEGRRAVLLHVDVANATGALRVYESVGMRAVLEIDAWAKGERAG